jgi:hypothetical protein
MRKRCRSPNNKGYKYYGGRGIKCCERWDDYLLFIEDMGRCPPGYGIERRDVNGDYEPSNCSWEPLSVQSENRRNVIEARAKDCCVRGHKWADGNLHINPYGYRVCRACDRSRPRREGRTKCEAV